jgi:hypothetical protein
MLDLLTVSDFVAHVNTAFRIALASGDVIDLDLIEATTIGERRQTDSPGIRQQAFSLIFQGPRDRLLSQRIYPVEHPVLGSLDIFLVPLGPGGDLKGLRYQAVFN